MSDRLKLIVMFVIAFVIELALAWALSGSWIVGVIGAIMCAGTPCAFLWDTV